MVSKKEQIIKIWFSLIRRTWIAQNIDMASTAIKISRFRDKQNGLVLP
jgi:hypothetical protein